MSSGVRFVVFATGLCGLAETALSDSLFDLPALNTNPQAEPHGTGIDAFLSLTQFYDTRLNGPAGNDADWKYGDTAAPHVTVDGSHRGPWDAYAVSALGELIYGQSLNTSDAGTVLPVNKAKDFTQRFSGVASPKVGKVGTVDLGTGTGTGTPIVGGDQTSKVGGSDFDPTSAVGPAPSSTKLGRIGQRLSILRAKLMGLLHRPGASVVQPSQPQTDKATGSPGNAR